MVEFEINIHKYFTSLNTTIVKILTTKLTYTRFSNISEQRALVSFVVVKFAIANQITFSDETRYLICQEYENQFCKYTKISDVTLIEYFLQIRSFHSRCLVAIFILSNAKFMSTFKSSCDCTAWFQTLILKRDIQLFKYIFCLFFFCFVSFSLFYIHFSFVTLLGTKERVTRVQLYSQMHWQITLRIICILYNPF